MKTTITKEVAENVTAGQKVMDSALRGFGVRGTSAGASYILRYKRMGQAREMVLGRVGEITATQARRMATKGRGQLADGVDPLAAKTRERDAEVARIAAEAAKARLLTVEQFIGIYKETAWPKKKPSSQRSDGFIFKLHIVPKLGDIKIAALSEADASRLHAAMAKTPTRANRTLALLSHLCAQAEKSGYRPKGLNPCKDIDRNEEKARERYLSPTEQTALWKALTAMEATGHRDSAQALKLLVLTGCRKSEIVTLTWAEVDVEGRQLRLADSKTGRRTVPLFGEALRILKARKKAKRCDWVFPREDEKGPRPSIEEAWRSARSVAKLDGVRCHDLRHSFAAAAVAAGLSLTEIGKLLGHKAAQTTARYAHVSDSVARAAANRVGARLAGIVAAADGLRAVK